MLLVAIAGCASPEERLAESALEGKPRGVARALSAGIDVNAPLVDGQTALLLACAIKSSDPARATEVVRLLIDAGADVNTADSRGRRALTGCANLGNLKSVKALVAAGAEIDAPNDSGWTALMAATMARERDVVEFLLMNGANADLEDEGARTARSIAAASGDRDLAGLFAQAPREALPGS